MTSAAFLGLMNRAVQVNGFTATGEDGGGQPTGTTASKGTLTARIDKKDQPDEVNGPDLNPIISEYEAFTPIPTGFTITESDTLTTDDGVYEVLQVGKFYGRVLGHHLQLDLRKITP